MLSFDAEISKKFCDWLTFTPPKFGISEKVPLDTLIFSLLMS